MTFPPVHPGYLHFCPPITMILHPIPYYCWWIPYLFTLSIPIFISSWTMINHPIRPQWTMAFPTVPYSFLITISYCFLLIPYYSILIPYFSLLIPYYSRPIPYSFPIFSYPFPTIQPDFPPSTDANPLDHHPAAAPEPAPGAAGAGCAAPRWPFAALPGSAEKRLGHHAEKSVISWFH